MQSHCTLPKVLVWNTLNTNINMPNCMKYDLVGWLKLDSKGRDWHSVLPQRHEFIKWIYALTKKRIRRSTPVILPNCKKPGSVILLSNCDTRGPVQFNQHKGEYRIIDLNICSFSWILCSLFPFGYIASVCLR